MALEASIYHTISNALVIFAVLRQNLVNFKDRSVDFIRNMANSMSSKLQEYWSNILSLPCVVAAVFDPRIKLKLFSDEQTKCVIDMMNEIYTYYGGSIESETKENVVDISKINNFIDLWKTMSLIGNEENKNDELTKYFNLSSAPSSVDVLQWWKIREIEFPILSKVVRNHYCISATSTSVERIFSTSGRIYDDQRANLSPDVVNKFIYLNNWIKFIKT